ncbi:MAG: hypothetical protein ACYDHH_05490 [Solirubrobacteraceae bacterium]
MHASLRSCGIAVASAVALGAAGGALAASPPHAAPPPQYDFFVAHDSGTLVTMLLLQPGTGFQAGVSFACVDRHKTASEDIPNAILTSGGRFSYNGPADYSRAGKLTHVRVKLRGAVIYKAPLSLSSATSVAVDVSSAAGCGSYVGTLKLKPVPPR